MKASDPHKPLVGKRRTRAHVLADLGVNFVEAAFLRAGCSLQRITSDYGLDLLVVTHDSQGYVQPGWLAVQVKSTEAASPNRRGEIPVLTDNRDVTYWLRQHYPVLLILYDHARRAAFGIDVHSYFSGAPREIKRYHSVCIPSANRLTQRLVRKWMAAKAIIVREAMEVGS